MYLTDCMFILKFHLLEHFPCMNYRIFILLLLLFVASDVYQESVGELEGKINDCPFNNQFAILVVRHSMSLGHRFISVCWTTSTLLFLVVNRQPLFLMLLGIFWKYQRFPLLPYQSPHCPFCGTSQPDRVYSHTFCLCSEFCHQCRHSSSPCCIFHAAVNALIF